MPKAKTLADKLLLKKGQGARLVNAPDPAPEIPAGDDATILFATTHKDLGKAPRAPKGRLWVCYPKAGKLGTDLSRDALWQAMEKKGWEGVRLVALDDTWSAMAFRSKA